MGKVIIATGIPGSGKTTVLGAAKERTSEKFSVVTFGTVMFDMAKEKKLVKHRDELRMLPQKKQKDIQKLAGEKIAAMAKSGTIVVDTHCTIKTPSGYLPGLPEWVLHAIKPDVILIVESSAAEIASRRGRDDSRVRDAESEEEIEQHHEINRANATACSILTGATVKIIYNYDNHLDAAARDMAEVIEC